MPAHGIGAPQMHLTDIGIRALPAPDKGQKDYYDEALHGFGVRISQGGTRSFFLLLGGKYNRQRVTLGRFGVISLAQARTEAKRLLAEKTLGKARPQSVTFPQAVELFLDEKGKALRPRTVRDYKRLLNRFGFKGQLTDLNPAELQRRLNRFQAEGEYNHMLVALKVFSNWAIKRRYIEHNPTMGLSQHKTEARSRVLSDEEIAKIWAACEQSAVLGEPPTPVLPDSPAREPHRALPANFARIVQLLILTGQRRGEIAALQSSWIKNNSITFPANVTKNGRQHSIPITVFCADLLTRATSTLSHANGYIFFARTPTSKPFNGWSKAKGQLDKISGVIDWTLHDLRRTYATRMASIGCPPHIIERLLNHVTGQISGVAAIYNRHSYLDEARIWTGKYEAHLKELIPG